MSITQTVAAGLGCFLLVVAGASSYLGRSTPVEARLPESPVASVQPSLSAVEPATAEDEPHLVAERTLRHKLELLQRGRTFLESVPGYTAEFRRQEVVQGELLEEQTISMKCRHQPFSVYLLWLTGDVGQEVLYVEGTNNGRLLAHDGGWKARLPAFSLVPTGSLAMRDSRYPVTAAGLLGLIDIMSRSHHEELERRSVASCELNENVFVQGRPCLEFTTRYKSHAESPKYRKSITRIDREWNVPVETWHFEWPVNDAAATEQELDAATLVEAYRFADIDFSFQPSDLDFDRANPEYRFR